MSRASRAGQTRHRATTSFTLGGNPYGLVFDEEFNGSALDTSKWSTGWLAAGNTKPVNGTNLNSYNPSQVTISGGLLNLAAVSQVTVVSGTTYNYASGIIHTYGKYTPTFGYIEARVFLPASSGTTIANFPGWWCDCESLNWPTDGELDIVEGLSGTAAAHFHDSGGGPSGGTKSGQGGGWHIFAAWWKSGSVRWYYDNVYLGTVTSGITSQPMFLILNLAIDTTNGGPLTVPSTMQVDWVHVYQLNATPITAQANYTGPGGGSPPSS